MNCLLNKVGLSMQSCLRKLFRLCSEYHLWEALCPFLMSLSVLLKEGFLWIIWVYWE